MIANHLAAVAAGPWSPPSFQQPIPRSPVQASRPASARTPPGSQQPHSPVVEQLRERAEHITPEMVLAREIETKNGHGSPLRLDDAIIATTRARDESERVMAEVLAGIERSFHPHDDKRLVCRAYVSQLGRTAGRMRDTTARLEREAADAVRVAATERSDLLQRLYNLKMKYEGHSKVLESELERSESERAAHGDHMHNEFERLRRERETEAGRLGSDVTRLSTALEASRSETHALWTQSQAQHRALTSENDALRSSNATLQRELEKARDAHGSDAATLRAQLTIAEGEKRDIVQRMRADLDFMAQLASATQVFTRRGATVFTPLGEGPASPHASRLACSHPASSALDLADGARGQA